MKNKQIIIFLLLILVLTSFVLAVDEQNQAYFNKLVKSGLANSTAESVISKYPTENELLDAVRKAVSENKTSIEITGGSLALTNNFKEEFYKPGVITTWINKQGIFSDISKATGEIYRGLFGTTLEDTFNWIIGVKKDDMSRLLDLLVGYLTALLIAFIFLLSRRSYIKYFNTKVIATKKDLAEAEKQISQRQWLVTIIGKRTKKIEVRLKVSLLKAMFLFPVIYFALFQVPFINRVLEIITFYHFMPISFWPNVITRVLFSSLVIGFFPDLVERWIKMRKEQKRQKAKLKGMTEREILNMQLKYYGKRT